MQNPIDGHFTEYALQLAASRTVEPAISRPRRPSQRALLVEQALTLQGHRSQKMAEARATVLKRRQK